MSPLGSGSPVRYYAVAAPVTFPATLAATIASWEHRSSRPWLLTATVCSISGVAVTAYLVRTVNTKLFFDTRPLPEEERKRLLRTWYRVNAAKLLLSGGAVLAVRQARSTL